MNQSLPTYSCIHVAPFSIDGNLHKPVWQTIPSVSFVPATGEPQLQQPTTLRACWSATHLYVAFHCDDAEIHSTFTQHDDPLYNEDVVEVFLSPTGDLHHYYELEFSPLNTIFDAVITNHDLTGKHLDVDKSWHYAGLQAIVRVEQKGVGHENRGVPWSVEIALPFAGLGTPTPAPGDRWRANFYRIDYTEPAEYSAWSPTLVSPARYHVPERFGWLSFEGEDVSPVS